MLSHLSFAPREKCGDDEDSGAEKRKLHKKKKKKDKRKHRAGDGSADDGAKREASPVLASSPTTDPAKDDSPSPVRLPDPEPAADDASPGRRVLACTPSPDRAGKKDAAVRSRPAGDEFDTVFGVPQQSRRQQEESEKKARAEAAAASAAAPVAGLTLRDSTLAAPSAMSVGDGGASWRMKALKRAQERAAAEGRSLDQELTQRYADADVLVDSLLKSRGIAHGTAHLRAAASRRCGDSSKPAAERRRHASYLEDEHQGRMRRAARNDVSAAFNGSKRRDGGSRHVGMSASDRAALDDARAGRADPDTSRRADRDAPRAERPRHVPSRAQRESSEAGGVSRSAQGRDRPKPRRSEAGDELGDAPSEALAGRVAQQSGAVVGEASAHVAGQPSTCRGSGGNASVAAELRAMLTGKPSTSKAAAPADKSRVEALPSVDHRGHAVPGAFGREGVVSRAGPEGKRKLQRYADGARVRYFADDDSADLDTLVKRAKFGDDMHDMDRAFADNVTRQARFKQKHMDADEEYDADAGLELYEKRSRRGTAQQQEDRAKRQAVAESRRSDTAMSRCTRCYTSSRRNAELTLSIADRTYLALPERGSLAEGHCVVIPVDHAASFRACDEDVYEEFRNFQKCLIQMFAQKGKHCIFIETALNVKDYHTHAAIECIPVDEAAFSRAPLVFRQEIGEAESEFSQHHAKRIIDTSDKGLRRSIPEHFPYFHVIFGYKKGFVHVIDDERKWKRDFGRSVMVSLSSNREEDMFRRAQRDGRTQQTQNKTSFLDAWDEFDWTKQLA